MVKRKSVKSVRRDTMPTGVKIVSVIFFVGSFLKILLGIFFLALGVVGGSFITNEVLTSLQTSYLNEGLELTREGLFSFIVGALIFLGILSIIFGVIEFFVASGLWKRKKWARILAIVFMAVLFIWALFVFEPVSLVISALIGGYLLFSKDVQRAFAR